jgi:GT2 family glycosyltransferase
MGVGISTRDRWADLAETLDRLAAYALPTGTPIIVIDDCSAQPCPAEIQDRHPGVKFLRDAAPQGYPAQRNRLARLLAETCDFYLCVDDDSFPVSGSLDEAIAFLDAHPDVFCLAFNIVHNEAEALPAAGTPTRRVKSFIGCAHLVDLAKFQAVGGYRRELFFYNEEEELSARAWGRDWPIVYFPRVTILHRKNPAQANRNTARRAYYFSRGKMLLTVWNTPLIELPYRMLTAPLGCLKVTARQDWLVSVRGSLKGLWDALFLLRYRSPLPRVAYHHYRRATWPPVG